MTNKEIIEHIRQAELDARVKLSQYKFLHQPIFLNQNDLDDWLLHDITYRVLSCQVYTLTDLLDALNITPIYDNDNDKVKLYYYNINQVYMRQREREGIKL